jgi:O-antigen/teichoic acid export membrane protein
MLAPRRMKTSSLKNEMARSSAHHGSGLIRNALWMTWSGAISIANSVLLWALLARWRTTEELGRFTIVMSLYALFVTICSLGLGPYIASQVAGRIAQSKTTNENQSAIPFIASSVCFLFAWSVVCAIVMSLAGLLASSSTEAQTACAVLSMALLPTGLIAVAEPVCNALGRARAIALAATLENLLRTIVPLWLLYRGRGLIAISLSFVGVRVIACLIYAWAGRKQLGGLVMMKPDLLREIARRAPTFAGVAILSALHFQLAAVLLGRASSETEAAQFGAASRILIPVMVLMGSYVAVVQPVASRLVAVSLPGLSEFLSRSLRLALALLVPVAVGAILLAREFLTLLFSDRFIGAAPALALLALGLIPFGVVMIVSRGLIATGNERIDLLGNVIAVVVCLTLSLALIPRYGATGAAAAQLISMTLMMLTEVVYSAQRLYRLEFGQALQATAIPLGLMSLIVWQARSLGFWIAVAGGAFVYLACLGLNRRRLQLSRSDY